MLLQRTRPTPFVLSIAASPFSRRNNKHADSTDEVRFWFVSVATGIAIEADTSSRVATEAAAAMMVAAVAATVAAVQLTLLVVCSVVQVPQRQEGLWSCTCGCKVKVRWGRQLGESLRAGASAGDFRRTSAATRARARLPLIVRALL